jgi:signal peptide peptidase SppA
MNQRFLEVLQRIGGRPALIRIVNASEYFGENAPYAIVGGIGVIDISGPLSNERWSWGGTTYGGIQNQLKIASQDPNVNGILLNVNSPGGETDNAFETAAMIASLEKPCYAVASTIAYSAGYLLASQAEQIFMSPVTGGVGSIGVYCAHLDYSEMLKKMGIGVTLISAGEGKTLGNPYEPLTESALEEIQGQISRLYGEFVGAVATGRKMLPQDVVKMGAKLFEGSPAAIAAKLADAPGNLDTAITALQAQVSRASGFGRMSAKRSAATAATKRGATMNDEDAAVHTAAEMEAAIAKAEAAGFARAVGIVELCSVAGVPAAKAAEFLQAGKTAQAVSTELLSAKVAADAKAPVDPSVMPGTDANTDKAVPQGKAKPWGEVLQALGLRKKEVV